MPSAMHVYNTSRISDCQKRETQKNYMEFMLFLSGKTETSWLSCMDMVTQQTARHSMGYLISSLTERNF